MKATRLFAAIGLFAAAAASAQESSGPNGQSPAKQDASGNIHDLDIRYARVALSLAELELQRGLTINKQIPGTFTRTTINALEQVVIIRQEQLKALTQKGGARIPMYLIAAEANAKAARQSLERVLAINQQNPGTITPMEIERLRLTTELADVVLEKARSVNPKDEAQFLQWQLDELRDEMTQLRNRVAQLSRLN